MKSEIFATENGSHQNLYAEVRNVLLSAKMAAHRVIHESMLEAYWQVGRLIVEDEQQGSERAQYGKRALEGLSKSLNDEFGKGFDLRNLRNMRAFYLAYPIRYSLRTELTWTHYRHLLRVENKVAREWYEREAVEQGWSSRALDRQINTLFYDRLLSSKDKENIQKEATANIKNEVPNDPREFIRDPYVLEFLGIKAQSDFYEKDLEGVLLNQLQQFLMELGKGFAFVARQKHLRVEGEDYFVDLVFYNYLLKCFLLIDLKVGKLAHQDVGQMDMYVRIFEEQMRGENDNPTLGLILCSERNSAVAKYSQLSDSPQLFSSKYQFVLPSESELREELERDRAMIESKLSDTR